MEIKEGEVGQTINVDTLIKNIIKKPLTAKEFADIETYFNSYKRINFIKELDKGHIYDKNEYDYYIVLEHSSWYVKLVMRRSIAHLVYKYRIPDYLLSKKLFK